MDEVAERHQHTSEDDRIAAAKQPIANQTSEYRSEIDQAYVKAESLRRQGLNRQRSGDPFQTAPIGRKAHDPSNMPRQ
jgi:hypothetical protein